MRSTVVAAWAADAIAEVADLIAAGRRLVTLDLEWTTLGDLGAGLVGASLAGHPSLITLDLSSNRITADGADRLALGLAENTVLETLILYNNPLGDEGSAAIFRALPGTGVRRLTVGVS